MTDRQDRFIITTSRRNRFIAAPKVADQLRPVTGERLNGLSENPRLRSANLRPQRHLTAVVTREYHLTQHNRQFRLAWANARHRWIQRQWNGEEFEFVF